MLLLTNFIHYLGSSDFFGLNHYTTYLCTTAQPPYSTLADKDSSVKLEKDSKWSRNHAGWTVSMRFQTQEQFLNIRYLNFIICGYNDEGGPSGSA